MGVPCKVVAAVHLQWNNRYNDYTVDIIISTGDDNGGYKHGGHSDRH